MDYNQVRVYNHLYIHGHFLHQIIRLETIFQREATQMATFEDFLDTLETKDSYTVHDLQAAFEAGMDAQHMLDTLEYMEDYND